MIKTYKPTSAGIRARKTLVRDVDNVAPEKSLSRMIKGTSGRSSGRVSIRHRQRGSKRVYRIIDFKRNKYDVEGKVASIQIDPNRGPSICLISYKDGEKRYILAPKGLERGMTVVSGKSAPISIGNALPLSQIPLSTKVHNIELNPGKGGQIVRGAGNSATVMAKEGKYVTVRLPSGEMRKFLEVCYATIGELGNEDLRNARFGKAGLKRRAGWRPEVRGVTMGAYAHPHGGSYGHTGVGLASPKTPWGKKARGVKTRKRTRSNKFVVKQRGKRS